MIGPAEAVRVDVWLWAARLIKTRPLAATAVRGGRVHLNGVRVKPGKDVRAGDRLDLALTERRMTVVVTGTAKRRGSAAQAALLYEETDESRAARELDAAQRRLAGPVGPSGGPRPTKRDRRRLPGHRGP